MLIRGGDELPLEQVASVVRGVMPDDPNQDGALGLSAVVPNRALKELAFLERCLNQGARFKPPPSHIVAERVIPLQSPGVRCWDTQRLLECKRLKSCIKDITTLFATPSINYDPSSAPLAIIYILDIA